jgi:hypothetical protein
MRPSLGSQEKAQADHERAGFVELRRRLEKSAGGFSFRRTSHNQKECGAGDIPRSKHNLL